MKLLIFTILCSCLAILVIGGLFRNAPACQPGTDAEGQPITKPRPTDHKLGQRLADYIKTKMQGKG